MPMDLDSQAAQAAAMPDGDPGPEPPTAQPAPASTSGHAASTAPPPLTYTTHFSKPAPTGTGKNRRDPFIILLIAFMLLMSVQNLHFSAFWKMISVWLFAHTAQHGVYTVLSRFGFSTSYTSVLKFMHALSKSAQSKLRDIARLQLGQRDTIHNRTAVTFVELEDCDPKKAFDPEPLWRVHQEKRRAQLTCKTLHHRIDHAKLNSWLALHCLLFLTTLAAHCMQHGHKTQFHPMASSNFNERNTAENAKVLHDLIIMQLGLPEEEVAQVLTIVAGDQSTIEKLCTLKKFLASCPHGYSNYGWVLPLIQLWHMGWSDLERIINMHWGSEVNDVSSFCSTNVIMGRNVKNIKRPDYYPAQHLVFDTLKVEILDCWRKLFREKDLDQYFTSNPMAIEDLLKHAQTLLERYCSTAAYTQALYPDQSLGEFFGAGKPWTQHDGGKQSVVEGDQYAVADGDIGRAMNVMAVWVFTFAGSG
ncbi:hypothetical protein EWM64_g8542 [Hericium alpestre]|uniref:DUF6589 domain-containing protein n=1 Tax=Hericium alpestre TaxID=135208 RepID=A0A4Y9ZMJ8_9AGAM|nr:hypothetical protein EWM64_g8542 [Hericium alpestre]